MFLRTLPAHQLIMRSSPILIKVSKKQKIKRKALLEKRLKLESK